MTPTIGRIVHFRTDHATQAALIVGTYATPPDQVDLAVFPRGGGQIARTAVREGTAPGFWSWPPIVPNGAAREGG
jgi:hypothetical protein